MDYVSLMRILQRGEHLLGVLDGILRGEGPATQPFGQRFTLDELHHHHYLVAERKRRPEQGDVGMVESGEHLDLAKEPSDEIGAPRGVGQQHLQGFDAIGDHVPRPVDAAHASTAQLAEDLVVADAVADLHGCSGTL